VFARRAVRGFVAEGIWLLLTQMLNLVPTSIMLI